MTITLTDVASISWPLSAVKIGKFLPGDLINQRQRNELLPAKENENLRKNGFQEIFPSAMKVHFAIQGNMLGFVSRKEWRYINYIFMSLKRERIQQQPTREGNLLEMLGWGQNLNKKSGCHCNMKFKIFLLVGWHIPLARIHTEKRSIQWHFKNFQLFIAHIDIRRQHMYAINSNINHKEL